MEKSFGDAYEVGVATRTIRLLTHYPHAGFLRVQFLPNGDYFLIGARTFADIQTTRSRDQEMWVLKGSAKPGDRPIALDHKIVYDGAQPRLVNRKEVIRAKAPECTLEAQDFRRNDTELIYTCYRSPFADVFGIDLASGKVTVYRKVSGEYNEVEGIFPDGEYALVESSRDQREQNSNYIDIWKLKLEPNSQDFTRVTRWGEYAGYKASNPVVSSDGRRIAFQSARSKDAAGVGYGIFVMTVQ